MTKNEFLSELTKGLSGLPYEDIESSVSYYTEMIDDRIEDGLSEEEAVAALGSVQEVVAKIMAETPLAKLVKAKVKPKRRLKGWEIAVIILGSPIWVSLLITAAALLISFYAVLWSVVITLYAASVSLFAGFVAGLLSAVAMFVLGHGAQGVCMLGFGFICGGIGILWTLAVNKITVYTVKLCRLILVGIKKLFVGGKGND